MLTGPFSERELILVDLAARARAFILESAGEGERLTCDLVDEILTAANWCPRNTDCPDAHHSAAVCVANLRARIDRLK